MKQNDLRAYYVFSPFTRLFHWIMVVAMVVLFFTGLYIGNPFYIGTQGIEPTYAVNHLFSMENMRYNHFVAAYILVASLILRVYGWLINKGFQFLRLD